MATISNLPDDVLSNNIFIYLPAKLLAQMRCVCKPWNALLSHSSFIKSLMDCSIFNKHDILMVFQPGFYFDDLRKFTVHNLVRPHVQLPEFIRLPSFLKKPYNGSYDIIGSVNGLICFIRTSTFYDSVIFIWNPSLGALLPLPPYNVPPGSRGCYDVLFRFGYDPKTDDYKVVKLTGHLLPPKDKFRASKNLFGTWFYVVKKWLQVEVYSMRKGSWELITQPFPSHIARILDQDYVCVDGHDGRLHWLGYLDEEHKLQTIVAFNLGVKTFVEISVPDSLQEFHVNEPNVLGVLDGKLCLMSCATREKCEVWVMNKYGVAGSWEKLYRLSEKSSGKLSPYGFTLNKEFIFDDSYGHLALYDIIAREAKSFNFRASVIGKPKIVRYVDSLVWVTPPKCGLGVEASQTLAGKEKVRRSKRIRKDTPV
uniref:F-box protein CPR1-like n=1 Tax=Erigeron canadensis TaxID=72917 RepID=UPI001CB90636|nr:F-box protein CPR1-like [Erigeron canadensis]